MTRSATRKKLRDGVEAVTTPVATAETVAPDGEAAAPPREALFRQEVIAERQTQWLGTVLLEPRLSSRIFAQVALALLVVVLGFLFLGSYTRKARINGWIMPELGLVRVFAPQPGVITQIRVHEGDIVSKGAPMLLLSGEVRTETMGATRAEIVSRLAGRRDSLKREAEVQAGLFSQQEADLKRRLAAMRDQRQRLADEISLQRERLRMSQNTAGRDRAMRARDLIPLPRFEQSEQDRLDQSAKLQSLRRNEASLQSELAATEATLHELPFKRATQLVESGRSVATLEQELEEAEARRQIVITAPQDGIVSAIQAEVGGAATTNAPLLSIVPSGSKLEAHLFSPTRAIGFVKPGQHVALRYQAFPYQKFGAYDGIVVNVSGSALSPSELPQQLSGLTTLFAANEPAYRITVQLTRQNVDAYGEPVPLRPGMQLEADVMLDNRKLIEWVFEPLYALARK